MSRPIYSRSLRCLGLVIAAWYGVLLLRALPIGGEWHSLGWNVWLALIGWIGAYSLGYVTIGQALPQMSVRVSSRNPRVWLRAWIGLLSAIAVVGAALIAYEFAVVRGYGFGTPVALIRSMEVQNAALGSGGSLISGIGRLLTPALQIGWVLGVLRWREIRGAPKFALFLATAIVFFEQTMYEGGRFFLATLLVNCMMARALASWSDPDRQRRVQLAPRPRRLLSLPMILVLGVALVSFALVFLDRATQRNLEFGAVYQLYTRTFDLNVGSDVVERLSGTTGPLWFVAAMFWIYVTQGPNELAVLMRDETLVHAHGLFQFPQIGQAISRFSETPVGYDPFTHLENPGVYTTFAGAGYIDFGLLGSTLFALALGGITAAAVAAFNLRRMDSLTVCAPLLITLALFSPIISLVTNLWPAMLWAMLVGWSARLRVGGAGTEAPSYGAIEARSQSAS